MKADLRFHLEQRREFSVLRPRGRLDAATAGKFAAAVKARIQDARPNVAIDMRDATFVGSSAIAALLLAQQEINRCQGRLVLGNFHPDIASAVNMARLDAIFYIVDDVEDYIDRTSDSSTPSNA